MTNLQPYTTGSELLLRDARRTGRAISRHQSQGQLRVATIDVDTDVSIAKVDSLSTATGQAMGAVTRVAQLQKNLEQLAPEASGRLNFLADDHAMGCVEIMADLRRNLRRR